MLKDKIKERKTEENLQLYNNFNISYQYLMENLSSVNVASYCKKVDIEYIKIVEYMKKSIKDVKYDIIFLYNIIYIQLVIITICPIYQIQN